MSAAALLFKKQGFDRTTTQQIAETADIGARTLFLYVQDKSELLLLLYQRALERNILSSLILLRGKRSFNTEIVQFFQQVLAVYSEDLEFSRQDRCGQRHRQSSGEAGMPSGRSAPLSRLFSEA
jgi:AcrR family transcriptional regulator